MSARIPPGFAEAWFQWNLSTDPEPMFSAIGLDLAAGVSATQADTDAILDAGKLVLDNCCTNEYTLGPGYVLWGNDGGDIRIDGSTASTAGSLAAGALPNNCALLIRKNTASGGRRNRGRMYWPGWPETNVVPNGEITSATYGTVQAAANALQTDLVGLAQVEGLVLLHDTAPFTPTPITDLIAQRKIATQRRRMRR